MPECVRYIPVPTGNSMDRIMAALRKAVYPCTYRELTAETIKGLDAGGISLYLQGTPVTHYLPPNRLRYIPVPTGNSE